MNLDWLHEKYITVFKHSSSVLCGTTTNLSFRAHNSTDFVGASYTSLFISLNNDHHMNSKQSLGTTMDDAGEFQISPIGYFE